MKYEIRSRFTQEVQFTAEIDCDESANRRVKLGLAVKVALKGGADLRDADLVGAYLVGADLGGADLVGADLSYANLRDAIARGADLSGANLRNAYLPGADLSNANLSGANLRGVDLISANLYGVDLISANLYGADMRGADLSGADLGGLILLARATRSDGHEYFAWTSILGGMVIIAGCRAWIGEYAIEQAGGHCRTVTAKRYRAEALRIVDFIEGAATALWRDAA